MIKVLCSTGALSAKNNIADDRRIVESYDKLDCDGYEVMIACAWKDSVRAEEWAKRIANSKIYSPVVHFNKHIGSKLSEGTNEAMSWALDEVIRNCELANIMDATKAVLHMWGWPDNNFDVVLKGYKEALQICKHYNIELLVELIPCCNESLMNRVNSILKINPHAKFTLDTRLICYHDMVESIFDESILWDGNHISHVHISDCCLGTDGRSKIQPILHPGEGIIDFNKFFMNLDKKKYKGFITIESPAQFVDGKIDLNSINRTSQLLYTYIKSYVHSNHCN